MQENNPNPNPMPQQPYQAAPNGGKKTNVGVIIAIVIGVVVLIGAAGVGIFVGIFMSANKAITELDSGIAKEYNGIKKDIDEKKTEIEDNAKEKTATGKVAADDDAYFIKIDGKKFTNKSKLSDLETVGYKIDSRVADQDVAAGKYLIMIGGGSLKNEEKNVSFSITPYNDGEESVKFGSAKLGQVTIEKSTFEEKNAVFETFEFYGGIKLGSSEADLKKVFGEADSSREAKDYKDNPYTVYEYKDKTWKKFEFTVTDGKVTKIVWTNYGKLNN